MKQYMTKLYARITQLHSQGSTLSFFKSKHCYTIISIIYERRSNKLFYIFTI